MRSPASRPGTPNIDDPKRLALSTFVWVTAATIIGLVFGARAALAFPSNTGLGSAVPCAVIDDFSGEPQVMDAARTRVIDPGKGAGIPCGGWISVESGWVKLSHRDGYRIHLGGGTFAQLPENNVDGKFSGEPLVLLRGQAYARVLDGSPELKVLTANARARVVRGGAIVVYVGAEEETQLTSVGGESWLENRFSSSDAIKLRGGESTALNFKLQRTMPTPPRAVAISSLASKLLELRIGGRDEQYALKTAQDREERKFAVDLRKEASKLLGDEEAAATGRAPASARKTSRERRAEQEQAVREDNELMKGIAYRRLGGGHDAAELITKKGGRNPASARISVDDPAERQRLKRQAAEEKERRRLIDELTRIRESD